MPEAGAIPEPTRTVAYQANYDKETEHTVEMKFARLIGSIKGYSIEQGNDFISDPAAAGQIYAEIESVLQLMKQLFLKYHEDKTPISAYELEIAGSYSLSSSYTIRRLKELQDLCIEKIAVKHKLMDRLDVKEPWEKEVKKRFWLLDLEERHEQFAQSIKSPWKRFIFYCTAFMALRDGDIVCLGSGVNDSGKTNTAEPTLRAANEFLCDYWHVSKYSNKYVPLDKFTMKRDMLFYPDPEAVSARIGEGSQFNCVGINEGMKAAINLRAWDPEVINMIIDTFTERASHNFLQFEYQLAKRPPKMLLSRFNVWWHKMNQKWLVLSMPSSIYRTEDPLYVNEIEKIKGDRNISKWFTKKSGNANYIGKFKAPRMSPNNERIFKKLRKIAKEEYDKGSKIKKSLNNTWYIKVEEIWNKIRSGEVAYIQMPEYLKRTYDFRDDQVTKFIRDYERYDKFFKLSHPKKQNLEEQESITGEGEIDE